jgi:hypothetical protein
MAIPNRVDRPPREGGFFAFATSDDCATQPFRLGTSGGEVIGMVDYLKSKA